MKINRKGFTLAELLIVVAIIAVLVAVAIPIFGSQLEKSREAADLANVRAAYAEVLTEANMGIYNKEVIVNHLSPKELLDRLRFLCKGKNTPDMDICRDFNRVTRDGKNMQQYSELLGDAISSIINVKDESDIDSFLSGVQGSLFTEEIRGLDDFELICFLVIK